MGRKFLDSKVGKAFAVIVKEKGVLEFKVSKEFRNSVLDYSGIIYDQAIRTVVTPFVIQVALLRLK